MQLLVAAIANVQKEKSSLASHAKPNPKYYPYSLNPNPNQNARMSTRR